MSKVETKMRERYEKRAERDVDKPRKYRGSSYDPPARKTQAPNNGAYEMILVRHADAIKRIKRELAPDTAKMCNTGMNYKAKFVIRYWPSKKGWRVLDIRQAQYFMPNHPGAFGKWVGQRYLVTIFPNEDSAVVAAISLS